MDDTLLILSKNRRKYAFYREVAVLNVIVFIYKPVAHKDNTSAK
jgi:hypothetical protein